MNLKLKTFEIILLIAVVVGGGWWLMKIEIPPSYSGFEREMLTSINDRAKNELLSVHFQPEGTTAKITIDFSRKDLDDGIGMFEDTFSLVSATIQPLVPKQYSDIEYIVLIEGEPFDQLRDKIQ